MRHPQAHHEGRRPWLSARRPTRPRDRRGAPVAGIGRVMLWSGGSLWIGRDAGRVERHAHHAIQIALAMDSGFLMRDDDSGWREHAGAIVMPHRPHQFDGCGHGVAHDLRRARDRVGTGARGAACGRRRIADRPARHGAGAGEPAARGVLARRRTMRRWPRWRSTPSLHWPDRCRRRAPRSTHQPRDRVDEAAARFTGVARRRGRASRTCRPAASGTCSWRRPASRFAPTCCGRGSNRRWARRWAASRGRPRRRTAGFADSAHLSRTCRRMFGIAPVTLIRE